ncbi:2-C-methyl-D-erythritol 4-phosphate cytidylyltransferase [Marinobacter halodurans]|uniref:2-C-methyl-D-erythritol 4-phosphate cytidylyltransferase n=1 Tax=Marinobacter halodurans TaxID=2528979 RepID=A0ABY1ZLE9_9GAMM|nr:2-C-methyl-D-erythritol 4-phosphate cytidylyltransferase [Marinobacter halodurans]TBW54458.1 2-C-methyl-D-erythritol 4-phosphate cytidylyltransferase [Marinobacter halodurans]
MTQRQYWLVVPAAGIGQRMQADRPKQYLQLRQRYILDITLSRLLDTGLFAGAMVPLHPDDRWFVGSDSASDARILTCTGGGDRSDSVLSGLDALAGRLSDDDWVLVHDVARPCVAAEDIRRLIVGLGEGDIGGLLAAPVSDTIKRQAADADSVSETVDRRALWRAFTPQQFRYGLLRTALGRARDRGVAVTDESSALEAMGYAPKLVRGRTDNIKITVPEDLPLAGWILDQLEHK